MVRRQTAENILLTGKISGARGSARQRKMMLEDSDTEEYDHLIVSRIAGTQIRGAAWTRVPFVKARDDDSDVSYTVCWVRQKQTTHSGVARNFAARGGPCVSCPFPPSTWKMQLTHPPPKKEKEEVLSIPKTLKTRLVRSGPSSPRLLCYATGHTHVHIYPNFLD